MRALLRRDFRTTLVGADPALPMKPLRPFWSAFGVLAIVAFGAMATQDSGRPQLRLHRVGLAAPGSGPAVTDLVALASPGMGVCDPAELHTRARGGPAPPPGTGSGLTRIVLAGQA